MGVIRHLFCHQAARDRDKNGQNKAIRSNDVELVCSARVVRFPWGTIDPSVPLTLATVSRAIRDGARCALIYRGLVARATENILIQFSKVAVTGVEDDPRDVELTLTALATTLAHNDLRRR